MGRTQKGALKDEFRRTTGRELGDRAEQIVLNEGDKKCIHGLIHYTDLPLVEQFWQCDTCPRREKMDYSPGHKIRFPENALISTPNPNYGGGEFYTFRTNNKGEVKEDLPRIEWIRRTPLGTTQ